jgi:hypothetical protein
LRDGSPASCQALAPLVVRVEHTTLSIACSGRQIQYRGYQGKSLDKGLRHMAQMVTSTNLNKYAF